MVKQLEWARGLTQLFAPTQSGIYNYAPCVVETDPTTQYVFYCTNKEPGVIVDYIGWRKGQLAERGDWRWSEEKIALSPGESGWDSIHVCDPDLLQGEFAYDGHTYAWAMFYLGCDQLDCNHNQIGVAFADGIEGPWVKFAANPVVPGALTHWGTGQCSEISLDRKGKFKLIYRDADEFGDCYKITDCDFSNMANYLVGQPSLLRKAGLPVADLCMSHVAYDGSNDILYLAAEKDWDGEVRCCREIVIAALDRATDSRQAGSAWQTLATIDAALTGCYGNHNAAIGRDSYGHISKPNELGIYISSATQSFIWSFRICELAAKLTVI